MVTVNQILKLVSDHLASKTLDAFATDFAKIFYDIENTGDIDAIKLSYEIESKLADVSAGIASEQALENFLCSKLPLNNFSFPTAIFAEFGTLYVVPRSLSPINSWAGAESASATFDISASTGCGSVGLLPQIRQTSTGLPH